VLADAGLTEQDVARRIAEWTAVLAERTEAAGPAQVEQQVEQQIEQPAEGQQ
jgi:1-deoxy-D-xylulose-5-phosphate synthase